MLVIVNFVLKLDFYAVFCIGKYLKTPTETRWNSFYDSVCEIVTFEASIPDIAKNCRITFDKIDFIFLKEYCKVRRRANLYQVLVKRKAIQHF